MSPTEREITVGPAVRAEAQRHGAYMLRHFGWFYYALGLAWLLSRVRMEEHSAERIRDASRKGPVVYVLLYASVLDHLVLNTVLVRWRLPLSVWANGVVAFLWQPVLSAWRDLLDRWRSRWERGPAADPVRSGWVTRAVASGAPVTVFLVERSSWFGEEPGDPIEAVLNAQALTDRPIQVIPVALLWDRAPQRDLPGMFRALSRSADAVPGWIQTWRNLLLRSGEAVIQAGEPLPVPELIARVDEKRRARAARVLLRRFLKREQQIIRGPRLLPHEDMKRLVLDNPPMRELARREAEAQGVPVETIRKAMRKEYDNVAAHMRWWVIRLSYLVLSPLWTKVYNGVDVRPEDLDRIRAAMRGGAAILVPSHKSHFDYMLLAWVFYEHDLIIPHVVAGNNMAIWPISHFFRSTGGLFIQRRFGADRIHPAVFSRYVLELVRHGYPLEFFIEGGRTRSGKLLPPKIGVLGMVFDAAARRPEHKEVTVLPIAFAYEQVAEEATYARELSGEEKRPENLGQVLKARSVLRRRYGRVYLRVGTPMPLSPLVEGSESQAPWEDRSRAEQKESLQPAAERIMHRIAEATVVLPTSLVSLGLLAHPRRGVKTTELFARIDRFREFLRRAGAEEAASLRHFSVARGEALERFRASSLVSDAELDGERVWGVLPEGRIRLEFYKNQVLYFFATAGYAAATIRPLPDGPFQASELESRFLLLLWSLRREFILDPDRSAPDLLREGLSRLVDHGALAIAADGSFAVADPERIAEIYALVRSLLESALFVARAGAKHSGLDRKGLVAALQTDGAAALAAGELLRPESLSLVNLQNCVESFEEDGLFVAGAGKRLTPNPERIATFVERFAPMVD